LLFFLRYSSMPTVVYCITANEQIVKFVNGCIGEKCRVDFGLLFENVCAIANFIYQYKHIYTAVNKLKNQFFSIVTNFF